MCVGRFLTPEAMRGVQPSLATSSARAISPSEKSRSYRRFAVSGRVKGFAGIWVAESFKHELGIVEDWGSEFMSEHMIDVCGSACKIQVYRVAKNIWIAAGEYLGEHLRTRGSSAARATLAWRKAAEFRLA